MAEPPPPKDHFWITLATISVALVIIAIGVSVIASAPTGDSDWFGIGPVLMLPGVLALLLGVILLVAISSKGPPPNG